ncbi:ATP-binding protein [Neisseria weixii]|uniref:ATP-binding protein n=1 Tax=Neisseria weixii TaxID=1853276 RepID=A0A3N4NBA6_9NEIS|nr:ATP-binding protein [Neisseria weixii]RPD83340.1 ATP-binding protein [Neisseria weixii]RPD89370.1 ATP-binding protein [Neisseria weixii]
MAILTMILGESGTGKTTSLRNLNPENTALIQIVRKPLPFKPKGWQVRAENTGSGWERVSDSGNIYVTDAAEVICANLPKIKKDIIVIDDFQYLMANEFMRGVTTEAKGNEQFMKFNRIAKNAWDVITTAANLSPGKRVYILSHTQTDDFGKTKVKTVGKLLDEKITLEGLFSIVLRTEAANGNYSFRTQNNGMDTVKSPMGMFESPNIPNDLQAVDTAICGYYGTNQP